MEENLPNDGLHEISLDSVEENTDVAWFSLVQNLSYKQLEQLKLTFDAKCNTESVEFGLTKEEFLETIREIYGHARYSLQSVILFEDIAGSNKTIITWNDFLDFLMENMEPKTPKPFHLEVSQISPVPHTKREAIVKMVLIEMASFFCYVAIAKYGRIGLYDGNMNFLTSYHVIMTKEDEFRSEAERRRRNRWVTDAIFCPDTSMFIVTNTARSIMMYEASGLKHVPLCLILSTPNIIHCLAYKPATKNSRKAILFTGDDMGHITSFTFHKTSNGFMRKKHNDRMSLFYWIELPNEAEHVKIQDYGQIHKEAVGHIEYIADNETIITCSSDTEKSVVEIPVDKKRREYIFKMKRGTSCFAMSRVLNILITGSSNGVIRLWNPVVTSKPTALLEGHVASIVDIKIIEKECLFVSLSSEGVLKVWNIKEQKSIQTISIKFPCFKVSGKLIEWGINCIYPGPKRDTTKIPMNHEEEKNVSSINDECCNKLEKEGYVWNRGPILVTCCNYIAKLDIKFAHNTSEQSLEHRVLPPPPLQNSVLVPNTWKTCTSDEHLAVGGAIPQIEDVEKYLDHLRFVLDKDLLPEDQSSGMINYKIANLENTKLTMRPHVAVGAPYLALDLFDIETLRLADDLPTPTSKKCRYYSQMAFKLLEEARNKDIIFSEPSTSRSRSSRSSIVEFP